MSKGKDKLVRTTITIPASLKEKMSQADTNWSEVVREMLTRRLEEGQPDMAEAVILNERAKRSAPKDWSGLRVIKQWRKSSS